MIDIGSTLGPFHIEQELGSGAMGTVYKATYTETGQTVAIKFIGFGLVNNEVAMARFDREGEILKQLNHPHIVRLYATGRYKKTPFFAMEFVRGESLDRILERRGRLGWQEVVQLGKQLCQALQHAHEKGIIHRDLKPSNLMLLKDGTLKLTDFGIAKDTDVTALTNANSTVGTAAYMSPEQCKGERNLTAKSDLYSLGVVFYELLTGEKPFKKDSPVDMFMAHVTEPIERPSRKVLDIPPWLDTLVCQLLEKKPEHRPFDAAMVGRILGEVETKVAEQRSAGLDAATARKIDKPVSGPADAADKYIARVLRGAAKKKKVRIKTKPFYEQSWFLAVSLPLALACMGWFVWLLVQAPSVADYYRRADAAVKASDFDRLRDICEEFVRTHPNSSEPNAEQMRRWLEQYKTDQLEGQVQRRMSRNLTPENEAEVNVRAAINAENVGEINAAKSKWADAGLVFKNPVTVDEMAWAWLAKRRIAALDNLKKLEDSLRQMDEVPTSEMDLIAWEAVHLEALNDLAGARDRWARFKEQFAKDIGARPYFVLAAAKYPELKIKAPSSDDEALTIRRKILSEVALEFEKKAKDIAPAARRRAKLLSLEVSQLYQDSADAEIKSIVERAIQCRKELSR